MPKTLEVPKIDEVKDIISTKEQQIKNEQKQLTDSQKDFSEEDFSEEELNKIWKSFFKLYSENQSIPPPPTLSSLFDFPIIKQNNNTLLINVNNLILYQEQLNKVKPQLYPYLKKHLRQNEINIELKSLDSTLKTEDKVHLMNTKEKFEFILNRSPSMKELLNEFDFRLLE